MSVPKAKALLTVCAALLLCGCGQALSEREIVRAVFLRGSRGILRLSAAGRSEHRE
ncbi:hypothetical protein NIA69_15340 [Gemmiger formicilis]|nr:hypothetical protein [Gemmiger formicilis]